MIESKRSEYVDLSVLRPRPAPGGGDHPQDAEAVTGRVEVAGYGITTLDCSRRETLGFLCHHLMDANERVAVCEPSWPAITETILGAQGRYVDIGRHHDWSVRWSFMERVLEDGDVRLAVFSHPALPSGNGIEPLRLVEMTRRGCTVIIDDVAPEFGAPDVLSIATDAATHEGRLIVVGNPRDSTRTQVISHRSFLQEFKRAHSVSHPSIEHSPIAPLHLPRHMRFEGEIARRDAFCDKLRALPGLAVMESQAPFFMVKPTHINPEALANALITSGVNVCTSPHHTWRGYVAMALPAMSEEDKALGVLKAVLDMNGE